MEEQLSPLHIRVFYESNGEYFSDINGKDQNLDNWLIGEYDDGYVYSWIESIEPIVLPERSYGLTKGGFQQYNRSIRVCTRYDPGKAAINAIFKDKEELVEKAKAKDSNKNGIGVVFYGDEEEGEEEE